MEKQNKTVRQKRKKEDVARIRTLVGKATVYSPYLSALDCRCTPQLWTFLLVCLVFCADNAYSCDPRVKRFKELEKAEKEAKRKAKREAARQEAMERERVRIT